MVRPPKILITGGTGLLGKGMEETAPAGWSIVSVHQRPYSVAGTAAEQTVLDIRDKRDVDALFEAQAFDTVVHAAGIASVDYVEAHYAESLESNLVGTLNIISASRRSGAHLVYVSTNAVFDGDRAPYREGDPLGPVNKYGRIKVECERLVQEALEDFTIVRPILMYGWNHPECRPNPATWILERLRQGRPVEMVDDVFENPLFNLQCGEALWRIVERKPGGIFHLGGAETVNRHQFALRVAKAFSLDPSLVRAVPSSHFPGIAPRPRNTSFATEKMERELGVRPLTLEEGLLQMRERSEVKA